MRAESWTGETMKFKNRIIFVIHFAISTTNTANYDRPHVHPDVEVRGGSAGVNSDRR